jgi:hypothetical protein
MDHLVNTGRSVVLAALFAVLVSLVPSGVGAQPPGAGGRNKIDTVRFDVHGTLGWWWAFGLGFRVDIPIVPDGFIEQLDDELAITFGGEFQFVNWDNNRGCNGYGCWGDWSIWPMVAAQWNFYLTEKWSVFPELGFTVGIHECNGGNVCPTASPVVSFGARWHFAPPRLALLFRLSFPFGLQVGLNF